MIQPTGILTEPGYPKSKRIQAFQKDRYERSVKKTKDGTLDEKSRADLLELVDCLQEKQLR